MVQSNSMIRIMIQEYRLPKASHRPTILLTQTTAVQNEVILSYHKVHRLYFLAVVFVRSILYCVLLI